MPGVWGVRSNGRVGLGLPGRFVGRIRLPLSDSILWLCQWIQAVVPALFAVLFYGAIGGFVIIAVLGVVAGLLARQIASAKRLTKRRSLYLALCLAVLVDLPPAVLLAVLDKLIGPW